MSRLKLLQDYNNAKAGDVIELPGGIASVLILRKVAEFANDSDLNAKEVSEKPKKKKVK